MMNLDHVKEQPRWRVAAVSTFAKLMGVRIHVEGIPFGSNRNWKPQARSGLAGATENPRSAQGYEGTGI